MKRTTFPKHASSISKTTTPIGIPKEWDDAIRRRLFHTCENGPLVKRFLLDCKEFGGLSPQIVREIVLLVKRHPFTQGCYDTRGGLSKTGEAITAKVTWHVRDTYVEKLQRIAGAYNVNWKNLVILDSRIRWKLAQFNNPDHSIRTPEGSDVIYVVSTEVSAWFDVTPVKRHCSNCGGSVMENVLLSCPYCSNAHFCQGACASAYYNHMGVCCLPFCNNKR